MLLDPHNLPSSASFQIRRRNRQKLVPNTYRDCFIYSWSSLIQAIASIVFGPLICAVLIHLTMSKPPLYFSLLGAVDTIMEKELSEKTHAQTISNPELHRYLCEPESRVNVIYPPNRMQQNLLGARQAVFEVFSHYVTPRRSHRWDGNCWNRLGRE